MSEYLVDKQLIDRLKNDDDIALSIIYKKYWQALYISAYNILKKLTITNSSANVTQIINPKQLIY